MRPCQNKSPTKCGPGCRGLFLCGENDAIHRCDECARFDSDLSAIEHVLTCPGCSRLILADIKARQEEHTLACLVEDCWTKVCATPVTADFIGKKGRYLKFQIRSLDHNLLVDTARVTKDRVSFELLRLSVPREAVS
jgi:hypothetical protein